MSDNIDPAALAAHFAEQDTKANAVANTTVSVQNAVQHSPADWAQSNQLSLSSGVDANALANNPLIRAAAEKRAKGDALNVPSLVDTHPKVAQWMTDPVNAGISQGNTGLLQNLSDAMTTLSRPARSFVAGYSFDLISGIYGLGEVGTRMIQPWVGLVADPLGVANPAKSVGDVIQGMRQRITNTANAVAGDQSNAGMLEQGINSGFRSMGNTLPGLIASVATGNPSFVLASGAGLQGSQSATKALDQGKGITRATVYGVEDAVAEYAGEKIGVGYLLKDLKAGAPLLNVLARQMAIEVPSEAATTAWQNLNEWANLNPDKKVGDYLKELGPAEAQTVIATVTQTLLTVGLGHGVQRYARSKDQAGEQLVSAVENYDALAKLSEAAAKAEPIRSLDKGRFKDFMGTMAEDSGIKEIYVDANALHDALAQAPIETQQSFMQAMPDVVAQIGESSAADGLVRIPIEDYATHIAGTELDKAVLPNAKVNPEGMTYAQTEQHMQGMQEDMKTAADQLVAKHAEDTAYQEDVKKVYDNIYGQLEKANRFQPEANKKYAELQKAYFVVAAEEEGVSPSEMLQRFPLKVIGGDTLGDTATTLEQPAAQAMKGTGRSLAAAARRAISLAAQAMKGTGRSFTAFFSAASKGERAPSAAAPYAPAIDISESVSPELQAEYAKHKGEFDAHIAASIPGFREVQQVTAQALLAAYPEGANMLDIGASEGGFAKTVSKLSNGKIKTVALDPNETMAKFAATGEQVPGAEYVMAAFGEKQQEGELAWTEDNGTEISYYKPDRLFDVVHEAMTFQFMGNERDAQLRRVVELMAPSGLAIFDEKVKEDTPAWRANEAKKDAYKAQFFSENDLIAKRKEVLEKGAEVVAAEGSAKEQAAVGMNDYMPTQEGLEQALKNNFKYVSQYWDSGNFKGYVASNNADTIDKYLGNLGSTASEFSNVDTPRTVAGVQPSSNYGYRARDAARKATLQSFAPEQVKDLLRKTDWAILTAENPGKGTKLTDEENVARNAELRADLDGGIRVYRAGPPRGAMSEQGGPTFYSTTEEGAKPYLRGGDGVIKSGILAPKKVFDTRIPEHKALYDEIAKVNRYVAKAGLGSTGRPFWMAEQHMREELQQAGFDAVIFDEHTGVPSYASYGAESEAKFSYTPVDGVYDRPNERSFVVTGITHEQALVLGQKYGQDSVLTRAGLVYQDGTIEPGTGVSVFDAPPEGGYFTTMPDGTIFRIELNSGITKPYDGSRIGETEVEAVHFSHAKRDTLSGKAYGTGIRGGEAKRLAYAEDSRIKSRISFYVDEGKGVRPEPGLGKFKHEVTLTNMYDGANNPLRIDAADFNKFESAVIDAGFDGYYNKAGFGNQGVAVLLGKASENVQPDLPGTTDYAQGDALYNRALVTTREAGYTSASKLKRDLNILYGRAESLIQQMLMDGYIEPATEGAYTVGRSGVETPHGSLGQYHATDKIGTAELLYQDAIPPMKEEALPGTEAYAARIREAVKVNTANAEARVAAAYGSAFTREVFQPYYQPSADITEIKPTFYSALTRAIENHQQQKGTPDQWIGILKNLTQKGIKAEELEVSGVLDYLEERKTRHISWQQMDEHGRVMAQKPATDPKYAGASLPEGFTVRLYEPSKSVAREEITDFLNEHAIIVTPKIYGYDPTRPNAVMDVEVNFGDWEAEEPNSDDMYERAKENIAELDEEQIAGKLNLDLNVEEEAKEVKDLLKYIADGAKETKSENNITERANYEVLVNQGVDEETEYYYSDSDSPQYRNVSVTAGDNSYHFEWRQSYGESELYDTTSGDTVELDNSRRVDEAVVENAIREQLRDVHNVEFVGEEDSAKFDRWTMPDGENYRERLLKNTSADIRNKEPFTYTNHFDDENVIVHTRVDDRFVPVAQIAEAFPELAKRLKEENKVKAKVYFLEEMQSDWAQHGREKITPKIPYQMSDLKVNEAASATSGNQAMLANLKVSPLTDRSGYAHTRDRGLIRDQQDFWHIHPLDDVASHPSEVYAERAAAETERLRIAGVMWIIDAPDNTYQISKANYPTIEDALNYIVDTKSQPAKESYTAFELANKLSELNKKADLMHHEEIVAAKGEMVYDSPELKALYAQIRGLERADPVPGGAFVESTDAWVSLAMKDAIREAAAGGYDVIAWTTGDQQTKRWSGGLRQSVDTINWTKSADGKIHIVAEKNGDEKANTHFGENDLSAAIGKTMAKRIIEDPNQSGRIAGEEIVVSDLGMTKFYGDQSGLNPDGKPAIVTKVANKVLSKIGGNKVQMLGTPSKADSLFSAQPAFEITPKMRETVIGGQPLFQENRGAFNPNTLTISFLKAADLTTFLHESGHAFLEMDFARAARPGAPQRVKDRAAQTLRWFGVPDMTTWNAMTLNEKRPYHEKFARGFEAYLLEGKAPSTKLQAIFSTFRQWLIHWYRNITNLNVELTPEVRQVFDKMLATDDQIKDAEEAHAYGALALQGLTPENKAAYDALGKDASNEAIDEMQKRSMKDMKWLSNAKASILRKLQVEADSKRRAIRAQVTAEVMAEPINQARTFLRKGEMVDPNTGDQIKADKGFRLDNEALKEMYPETMNARPDLTALRGMTMNNGLAPDLVADMFGLPSGEALVQELITGEDARTKIEGMTDQRMLEQNGDLVDARAIQEAADRAVHNEARARFTATGLKALTKSPLSATQITKAVTAVADEVIAAKRVRDLRPAQYTAAETKANKEALKEVPRDPEKAQRAQRSALLNNRLASASLDALEEVRKGIEYMNKVQKKAAQSRMRGEYLVQLNALLDRFDLRKGATLKSLDVQRTPLAQWLEEEADRLSAVVPDVPSWIQNESAITSYKNLTMTDFRGVLDTVKSLELMARREEKQYQAIRGMQFAEERKAVLDRIREVHPEAFDLTTGEPLGMSPKFVKHFGDRMSDLGDKFMGEFINAETIIDLLEGGEFGVVNESLFGRMSKRADWKATRMGQIQEQFKPLFAQYSLKERYNFGRKDIAADIGMSLTRENALVVALLHGNAEGRERLANYGWDLGTQQAIVNLLDAKDVELAKGIWRLFDTQLWPELKELNDRTRGKSPPKVEALEVQTKHGKVSGGYFRLKYDSNLDERAHNLDEGAAVKNLLGGSMGMSAKTNQGSSTERKANVTMRPRLDLGVFAEAVSETVHDLAFREAVADTIRMLRDKGVQNTIKTAAGTPAYRALINRVREIAAPPSNPSGFIEKTLSVARKNTIVALMSGVGTALQNFTGLASAYSGDRVSPGRLTKEIALCARHPIERTQFMLDNSEYMKGRNNSFEQDLRNQVKNMTVNANVMPELGTWLVLMGLVDKATTTPVWNAAFYEGMAKFANDKAKAVDFADHTVRQTMGSGRQIDIAQVMGGHGGWGQLKKAFTMFQSYFNGQLGLLVRSGAVNKRLAKTNPTLASARFTRDFMLVYVMPMMLTKMLLSPPDKDPDQWEKNYLRAFAQYGMAMIPLLGSALNSLWAAFDPTARNYGYKITPIESSVEGVIKGIKSVGVELQGEGDDKDLKNIIMGTGFAVGLPGKLVADTTLGAKAWIQGEAGPEAVIQGPPRK